jgi:hypothetical protein
MSALTFPYPAVAGTKIKSAEYNANNAAVSTFLNTTKLNDDNLQDQGISAGKLVNGTLTDTQISASAAITRSKISKKAIAALTSTYTAATTDDYLTCSSSGGAFTVTLYAASGNAGRELVIKKTDSSFNAVTIDGNGSETIDGATTIKLSTQNEVVTLVCDGTNWQIADRRIPSGWISYTPTGSWIANVTYTGHWRRVGDSIEVQFKVATSGAPTSTSLTVNLPSGLTIDTTRLTNGTGQQQDMGTGTVLDDGNAAYPVFGQYSSTTAILIVAGTSSGAYVAGNDVTQAVPMTFGAADYVTLRTPSLPITGWEA